MTFWAVRAGKQGEGERYALEGSCLVAGWDQMPDLGALDSRAKIKDATREAHPGISDKLLSNWTGQLWAFRSEIKKGDLVALPRKGTGTIAFGEATGRYFYVADAPAIARHRHEVRWIDTDFSRSRIDDDILFSLGSILTVFQVRRDGAENRMRKLLGQTSTSDVPTYQPESKAQIERTFELNLKNAALDQIRKRIGQRFKGHKLAMLVAAVLQAKGFEVEVSPPGADGGVDILAAQGFFSGGIANLVVQVKSEERPSDAPTVRQLIGTMDKFQASRGLFVSWGGFKTSVEREFERDFFRLQFWNGDKLIEEILGAYDRFDEALKAQLPLERAWMLVPDDEEYDQ
jgi:restriction system protein